MILARGAFALALAGVCLAAASPPRRDPNVIVSRVERCRLASSSSESAAWLRDQQNGLFEMMADRSYVHPQALVDPDIGALRDAFGRATGPWLLFVHSGHGMVADDAARSTLCLRDGTSDVLKPIDDLYRYLPAMNVRGAVFVVNACESAAVDPRLAGQIPLSIISASPFVVRADSLLGSYLTEALARAMEDPSCDGLVTDEELFSELLAIWRERVPLSANPAFPKLRRQATSHIPLPFHPRGRPECVEPQRQIRRLVTAHGAAWGELGVALQRQVDLADGNRPTGVPGPVLPQTSRDFFVVRTGREVDAQAAMELKRSAATVLTELPTTDPEAVRAIARFAIFAEVYELMLDCGWVTIRRLRDGAVIGVRELADIAQALPSRRGMSWPRTLGDLPRNRVVGTTASKDDGVASICFEERGQCFLRHLRD